MDSLSTVGSISYGQAILWCLYPFGVLVGLELFLRALDGDDDDDDPDPPDTPAAAYGVRQAVNN